jgi:hypothetical protein
VIGKEQRPFDPLRAFSTESIMIRISLVTLHLVLGLMAAGAGQALARKPSGEDLRFETGWLKRSPFPDYRIPGLFMVLVIAPGNLVSFWSQVRCQPHASYLSMANGLLLIVWLIIQTAILGFRHPTQLIWAVLFPMTALLGFLQQRQQRE